MLGKGGQLLGAITHQQQQNENPMESPFNINLQIPSLQSSQKSKQNYNPLFQFSVINQSHHQDRNNFTRILEDTIITNKSVLEEEELEPDQTRNDKSLPTTQRKDFSQLAESSL